MLTWLQEKSFSAEQATRERSELKREISELKQSSFPFVHILHRQYTEPISASESCMRWGSQLRVDIKGAFSALWLVWSKAGNSQRGELSENAANSFGVGIRTEVICVCMHVCMHMNMCIRVCPCTRMPFRGQRRTWGLLVWLCLIPLIETFHWAWSLLALARLATQQTPWSSSLCPPSLALQSQARVTISSF